MNKPAYDECYLESMIQKCRYLFQLLARNSQNIYTDITRYMKCDYRKYMDAGNPLYLNKTPKQILGELKIKVDFSAAISTRYDEFILEWMADIYTYMQWKYSMTSADIADHIPPQELYNKYYPLHETSLTNGVEKLIKIYYSSGMAVRTRTPY